MHVRVRTHVHTHARKSPIRRYSNSGMKKVGGKSRG